MQAAAHLFLGLNFIQASMVHLYNSTLVTLPTKPTFIIQPLTLHLRRFVVQPLHRHLRAFIVQPLHSHLRAFIVQPLHRYMRAFIIQPFVRRHLKAFIVQPLHGHLHAYHHASMPSFGCSWFFPHLPES